jgi:hypothetical protein
MAHAASLSAGLTMRDPCLGCALQLAPESEPKPKPEPGLEQRIQWKR